METPMSGFNSEIEQEIAPTEGEILTLDPKILLLVAGGCYGSGLIHVPK
jgi:hypothetical protein